MKSICKKTFSSSWKQTVMLWTLMLTAQLTGATKYKHYFKKEECSEQAFTLAWQGFQLLRNDSLLKNPRYLTIVDYAKLSNQPRLFVLDVASEKVIIASTASHGIGSDPDSTGLPQTFSNQDGSHATSLGFYITGNAYNNHRRQDSTGLCLFGLDSGYNDAAAAREIVLHFGGSEHATGGAYVTDTAAGRSYGCPALPLRTNSPIIRLIKGGSCLFIYSPKDTLYPVRSTVLNRRLRFPIRQLGPPPNNCSCNIQPRR